MQVVNWPPLVFRVFAIANFILAGLGLLFLAPVTMWVVLVGAVGKTSAYPYFLRAFWTMTATNIVLLTLLIFGGIRLLQLRTSGVALCNAVFVAEILYVIAVGFLWTTAVSTSVSGSVGAASGVGSVGLSPQLICGYPLLALVCLNLARKRLNRHKTNNPGTVTLPTESSR